MESDKDKDRDSKLPLALVGLLLLAWILFLVGLSDLLLADASSEQDKNSFFIVVQIIGFFTGVHSSKVVSRRFRHLRPSLRALFYPPILLCCVAMAILIYAVSSWLSQEMLDVLSINSETAVTLFHWTSLALTALLTPLAVRTIYQLTRPPAMDTVPSKMDNDGVK